MNGMSGGEQKARIIDHEEVRAALARVLAIMTAAHHDARKMSIWRDDLKDIETALQYVLQQRAKEATETPADDWLTKRRIEDGMVVGKIEGAKI